MGFVTIRDVAADAGVGIATVSRALNNSGYVAADVRQRVLEAAERLGYQPSERARSMRTSRSMTLAVVVPELVNPVYLEFLRGAEEVANRHGYVTVVANSRFDPERERAIFDRLVAERADGILIGGIIGSPGVLAPFKARGIPVVPPLGAASRSLNRAWEAAESQATESMVRRLLELGHRRVALALPHHAKGVSAPSRYRRSRTDVISRVVAEVGAKLQHLVVDRDALLPSAAEQIALLAGRRDAPTAYIAANHLLAPALLFGLASASLDVPGDVSVVTYGDSDWAVACRPALSVISHDTHGEAMQLTEMLLALIDDRSARTKVNYQAQFIERESCGPPGRGRRQRRANA